MKPTEFDAVDINLCKPKPKCPRPCRKDYRPVCGFNGLIYKMFSNTCVLQEYNDCEVKDGKSEYTTNK
jgi:Kazal-type serine protease inhibitor domain